MRRFRVWLRSKAAIGWEFYQGHVDVRAESVEEAETRARAKLKAGAFSDRPASSWIVEKVETL
jgi:hypothetical protein